MKQLFVLTSSKSYVTLYKAMRNIQKIRVSGLRYKTYDTSKYMLISIRGFDKNIVISSSNSVTQYFKYIPLTGTADQVLALENLNSNYYDFDDISNMNDIMNMEISVYFDGTLGSSTQIDSTYNLILELEFS